MDHPKDIQNILKRLDLIVSSDLVDGEVSYYLSENPLPGEEIVHSPIFHKDTELYKWIRQNSLQLKDEFEDNP